MRLTNTRIISYNDFILENFIKNIKLNHKLQINANVTLLWYLDVYRYDTKSWIEVDDWHSVVVPSMDHLLPLTGEGVELQDVVIGGGGTVIEVTA